MDVVSRLEAEATAVWNFPPLGLDAGLVSSKIGSSDLNSLIMPPSLAGTDLMCMVVAPFPGGDLVCMIATPD